MGDSNLSTLTQTERDFLRNRNKGNALVINIESVPAIENLDAILKVPDIDCLLIGPHDLSVSLGCPEDFKNPKFKEAICTIFSKARAAGVGAAIHMGVPKTWVPIEEEIDWITNCGCNVLIHSADIELFSATLRSDIESFPGGWARQNPTQPMAAMVTLLCELPC